MDICEYVKFKKIPGGSKSDCEMISGVVFTKNIANKKMASVLSNPKILVLSCAIDYQVGNKAKKCHCLLHWTLGGTVQGLSTGQGTALCPWERHYTL